MRADKLLKQRKGIKVMTRIEELKANVIELQEKYEKNMRILEEEIDKVAKELFSMIDLKNSFFTNDVVCRMIYNQIAFGGLARSTEAIYEQMEKIKTIIKTLESKQQYNVTFNLDYYNFTTDKHAKAIEECIVKLYFEKRKRSIYSLGITAYTKNLISKERWKKDRP